MFRVEPWAEAFAGTAALSPEDPGEGLSRTEEALEYLRLFCRSALLLPGDLSGRGDAERMDGAIQRALEKQGPSGPPRSKAAADAARRFILLMIRRGSFHQHKRIILGIEKIINRRKGREEVIVETAVEPDERFLSAVRKKAAVLTGAREIKTTVRVIPSLIGGVRLRIGSMLFDGSIKGQLKKMASDLSAAQLSRRGLEA
ncbi:MAG: F0F1 ATP synthase subunit delta [Treponema sp.]|jgi:F-type H+-transporting ATPase subunit delta|nr:F0F1 ATP synthase subunit delta [Treponema sp.]